MKNLMINGKSDFQFVVCSGARRRLLDRMMDFAWIPIVAGIVYTNRIHLNLTRVFAKDVQIESRSRRCAERERERERETIAAGRHFAESERERGSKERDYEGKYKADYPRKRICKQNVDHVRVEGEARWRARPDPRGVQGAFLLRLLLQPDVICNGG